MHDGLASGRSWIFAAVFVVPSPWNCSGNSALTVLASKASNRCTKRNCSQAWRLSNGVFWFSITYKVSLIDLSLYDNVESTQPSTRIGAPPGPFSDRSAGRSFTDSPITDLSTALTAAPVSSLNAVGLPSTRRTDCQNPSSIVSTVPMKKSDSSESSTSCTRAFVCFL